MPERQCPKCDSISYSESNEKWCCSNTECGMILTPRFNLNRPQQDKRFTYKYNQAGFTIVELLVVIGLIMLVVGVSLPFYMSMTNEAKLSAHEAQVKALEQAAHYHLLSGGGDVIWYAEGGEPARTNPTGDHESWMEFFSHWPECPLGENYMVEIIDGNIFVYPGVQ